MSSLSRLTLLTVLLLLASIVSAQEVERWTTPITACSLLADIPGMQTRGYKSDPSLPKEFFCSSPYKEIGVRPTSSLANNLAYYVDGDQNTAKQLKLVLNVNNQSDADRAHAALATASGLLTRRAMGADLADEVVLALLSGRSGKWKAGKILIEVIREDWPSSRGHEVKFIIR
jgi:hypothetical protein